MKLICALLLLVAASAVHADEVFRIEIGKDYSRYSQSDLQRRVWDLERAVFQLQQQVFKLETNKVVAAPTSDSWICTIKAMGGTYTGTGGSKAVATAKAVESCKAGRGGDGFFCKDAKCEQ